MLTLGEELLHLLDLREALLVAGGIDSPLDGVFGSAFFVMVFEHFLMYFYQVAQLHLLLLPFFLLFLLHFL